MRITVNNTSMMQPMFESRSSLVNSTFPTQRASGLLEPANEQDLAESGVALHSPQFYLHPNTDCVSMLNADWDKIQTVATDNRHPSYVVFGFHYDGKHDWLRVWLKTQQRYLWIQRPMNMTYRSYAALTMSVLSKLPTTWDGALHTSPFHVIPAMSAVHNNLGITTHHSAVSENTEAIVSDAVANEHGDLWFLVILNSTFNKSTAFSEQLPVSSGWIRASSKL